MPVDEGICQNKASMGQKHSAITWPSFRLPVVALILKALHFNWMYLWYKKIWRCIYPIEFISWYFFIWICGHENGPSIESVLWPLIPVHACRQRNGLKLRPTNHTYRGPSSPLEQFIPSIIIYPHHSCTHVLKHHHSKMLSIVRWEDNNQKLLWGLNFALVTPIPSSSSSLPQNKKNDPKPWMSHLFRFILETKELEKDETFFFWKGGEGGGDVWILPKWASSSCSGQMAISIQQLLKIGNVPWSSPKNQLFIIPCEHYWKCRPNEMCRKTYILVKF
jgi:hypothetical protein